MSPCPKCEKESNCGCKACFQRRGMPRARSQEFVFDGNFIKCPYCRTVSHCDKWLDAEYEKYKK